MLVDEPSKPASYVSPGAVKSSAPKSCATDQRKLDRFIRQQRQAYEESLKAAAFSALADNVTA